MDERRIIVLDASAFIAGFDPSGVEADIYSVPAVGEELSSRSLPKVRFDAAVEVGKLKVWKPNSHYLNAIRDSSKEVGDLLFLSEADMEVLALALQLKENGYAPTIVTDDYSIQNVARKISVDFVSLVTFGIRFHLQWVLYCPACRKKYPSDYKHEQCEVCGTRLKRKPLTKRPIKEEAESQQATETQT